MKIGITGLGSIGARHARNIQMFYPKAVITILTKRTSWEGAGQRTTLVSSEKKFFAEPHDLYFITNETHKHARTILQCLAHKPKGIFTEKPLTHNGKDLEKIRRAVSRQKGVFVAGYCMQWYGPLLKIKKLLASGAIGKVLGMRVTVGQDLRTWRPGDYRANYSADKKRGGGVILDLIHELNYPGWMLGEKLQLINGTASKISSLAISSEDVSESLLVSPKGVFVSVHQDYFQIPGGRSCEVWGSKGTLLWRWLIPDGDAHHIQITTTSGSRDIHLSEKRGMMYFRELKDFMRHVRAADGYTNIDEATTDMKNAIHIKKTLV